MEDKLDQLIKQFLEDQARPVLGQRRSADYPDASEFYRYLRDELEGEELERMLTFLKSDAQAQAMVSRARRLTEAEKGWENESVRPADIQRAKSLLKSAPSGTACPHCGKPITPFKKPLAAQKWMNLLWMFLALGAFAASFVFRRYFMQFLVLTVLAGVKWIVEMRATKTQILIYKAMSGADDAEHHRLHQHASRL